MKKILIPTLCLVGALMAHAQIDRSQKPAPAPAKEIQIGEYEKFELKNGLKVIVVENRKLPRVAFSLIVDREPLLEGNKVGYLSMVGQLMRSGTASRTKAQLDEEVDFIGANLSASSTSIFGSSLTKHREKLLDLFTDVLYHPSFPEEELAKIKKQTISGLKAAQEDPNAISRNVRAKLYYGSDHPYGEVQTEAHVENITLNDIKNYYNTYFKPNISYLVIVGDIDIKEAKKIVKKRFSEWKPADVPVPTYKVPVAPENNVVAIVNRASSVQTVLNIGYPIDLKPGTSDYIQARVMNQVLGGSSASRLFMNIREDKGYTYGAYSSISSDKLVGNFNASASVRTEVTDSSVYEFFYEMNRIREEEVGAEELQLAKNVLIGAFGRSLENPQTIATFAVNTERYNLPENYYNDYVKMLQGVSSNEVMAIAQKYIKPNNSYIIAVGKASEIASGLAQFGAVKYYDNYGNEVDPSLAKLPDGLTVKKVIAGYKEALGGDGAIDLIENVTITMSGEMMGRPLEMKRILAKEMKSNTSVTMGGMTVMSSISDGEKAVIRQMGNNATLDDATMEEQVISNALFAELLLSEVGAEMKLAGMETVNGKDAYVIQVKLPKGKTYTIYFDAESGLKTRYSKTMETPQGAFTQTVDYMDFKEVNGVKFPHTIIQQMGPQNIEMKAVEITVNQELEEDTFKVGE